jgi:hypothetical protein
LLDTSSDANLTFREAAEAFIRVREPHWRSRKHVQQWRNTLLAETECLKYAEARCLDPHECSC